MLKQRAAASHLLRHLCSLPCSQWLLPSQINALVYIVISRPFGFQQAMFFLDSWQWWSGIPKMSRLTARRDWPCPIQAYLCKLSLEGEERFNWPQLYCLGSMYLEKSNPKAKAVLPPKGMKQHYFDVWCKYHRVDQHCFSTLHCCCFLGG